MALINITQDICKKCYACVRVCPVKAIRITGNSDYPFVVSERCIGCGSCVTICTVGAVKYKNSKEETKELLKSGNKVAAICAPSISGEFDDITDYRKFVEMIRALGFDYVTEASFGVDIIAYKYKELFDNFNGRYYITTTCPPVATYIEKYQCEIIDNLAPLVSPMIATAKIVHKKYGENVKIVYIGPCIATKEECMLYEGDGKIDSVLTFVELRELFEEFNINENKLEYSEFDPPIGNKGSLYPLSNGLLQAMDISEDLLTGNVITAEGKDYFLDAVDEFEDHIEVIKRHFNLFYDEGCLMGPGMTRGGQKFLRRTLVTDYANKRQRDFNKQQWEKELHEYLSLDFSRKFKVDDQRKPAPSDDQVEEVMKVIGQNIEDKLGCGACGFRSCREFAIYVSQELTKPEMCLSYSLKNKQEFIKSLKLANEKLTKANNEHIEVEKSIKAEYLQAKQKSETSTAMLKKLPAGVVIVDEKLKIIESNEHFIKMLGQEAEEINEIVPGLIGADLKTLLPYNFYNLFSYVLMKDDNIISRDVHYNENLFNVSLFSIKKNKIVGAVVRDMYVPEVRKEEVLNRVTDVIDENLKMVQNIAFLLGEGASKTERMLNSIIETYKTGKNEEQ